MLTVIGKVNEKGKWIIIGEINRELQIYLDNYYNKLSFSIIRIGPS